MPVELTGTSRSVAGSEPLISILGRLADSVLAGELYTDELTEVARGAFTMSLSDAKRPKHPAAGKAGILHQFTLGHHWPGLPGLGHQGKRQ